jgi:putative transposase
VEEKLYRATLLGAGNFVSTVGRIEELIRNYIRHQEQEEERLDQLRLW